MSDRPGMALHWKILIGLLVGVGVGLVINLAWGPYTWGALGVGDASAYRAGQDAVPPEEIPPTPGPAIGWFEGALEDFAPSGGASPMEAPKNAYTARVVAWLLDPLILEPDAPPTPDADPPASDAQPIPIPEGVDPAAAVAWMKAQFAQVRTAIDDPDAEPAQIQPPEDPALRRSVEWLVQSLGDEKPNAGAGFTASVPRFVANLNAFVGDLFIRGLKFIAVPIVLFSLVVGASSLNDLKKLSRIGGKTIAIYILTTAVAITIGLVLANLAQPGDYVPQEVRDTLASVGRASGEEQLAKGQAGAQQSTWQVLLNIVPSNPFEALARGEMLQVVFFALVVGIALTLIPKDKARPIVVLCDGMTDVIIKLVHLVMLIAPYAVFALIVKVVAELGLDVLGALVAYAVTLIFGLALMIFVIYPAVLKLFTPMRYGRFFRGIAPAQLLAFSSSSSSATLPVTMDCAEERLGISEEVSSFVLPLGATINMDGTAMYQGVAALFIAQLYEIPLTIADQLTIVLTATLASIGTAGVPGVGLIMLVIVLQQLGFPPEVMAGGIAIIFGVDRLLDMCRTTCNVTGDAMVATVIAASERELLTEEEVAQRRARQRAKGLDEHPHEGSGAEYDAKVGGDARPVDVADQPGHRRGDDTKG